MRTDVPMRSAAFTETQLARLAADPVYQARLALLAKAWRQVRHEIRAERRQAGQLAWPDELLHARVQFWVCPVPEHGERGDWRRPVITVEWRNGVAHCTAPDCGRTSIEESG